MVEPEIPSARFWRFALAAYMPPEARGLFLRLQDEGGADVPMALFCLWCGSDGVRLPDAAMAGAVAFSAAWRTARVEPLRALRRGWKDGTVDLPSALSEAARQSVAKAEQAVERLQMEHLSTLRADRERAGEEEVEHAAHDNLALYCRLAGLSPDPALLDTVARMAWMDPSAIA